MRVGLGLGALAGRQRDLVGRVRAGVVDRDGLAVADDLGVAAIGLQLEAHAAVGGGPQAARRAGQQRRAAAGQAGAVDQMVGELDVGRDAVDRGRDGGVVQGLRQRLGRRLRAGADSAPAASAVPAPRTTRIAATSPTRRESGRRRRRFMPPR